MKLKIDESTNRACPWPVLAKYTYQEHIKKQEEFMHAKINEHCTWWQRLYLKLAVKFKMKIWFIENLYISSPGQPKSSLYSKEHIGIKINGKSFWMNDQNEKPMEGKCPKDGRRDRPVFITMNNKRTLAVADGEGHAYKVYGEGYEVFGSKCLPENKYDPKDYEFERGLSGMDY